MLPALSDEKKVAQAAELRLMREQLPETNLVRSAEVE